MTAPALGEKATEHVESRSGGPVLRIRTILVTCLLGLSSLLSAQDGTVRGTVKILHHSRTDAGNADTIVWLTNLHTKETVSPGPTVRLLQKGQALQAHVLAVTVGTAIEFPNQDSFFHDVFSIYHGKPFDLGLYESGAVRKVRFMQVGVSYIFLQHHPDMSAEVVRYRLRISRSPRVMEASRFQCAPGTYRLEIWHELATPAELKSLTHDIEITEGDNSLGTMTIHASAAHDEHRTSTEKRTPGENQQVLTCARRPTVQDWPGAANSSFQLFHHALDQFLRVA